MVAQTRSINHLVEDSKKLFGIFSFFEFDELTRLFVPGDDEGKVIILYECLVESLCCEMMVALPWKQIKSTNTN